MFASDRRGIQDIEILHWLCDTTELPRLIVNLAAYVGRELDIVFGFVETHDREEVAVELRNVVDVGKASGDHFSPWKMEINENLTNASSENETFIS